MSRFKRITLAAFVAAAFVSGPHVVMAQSLTTVTTGFEDLFGANPKGGKRLVAGVAEAASKNAATVPSICLQAQKSSTDQQLAAAAGLRQAYDIASKAGDAAKAKAIEDAVAGCGDQSATAFAGGGAGDSTIAADARVFLPTASSGLGGAGAVSPSRP
jgi:hypothetical protein